MEEVTLYRCSKCKRYFYKSNDAKLCEDSHEKVELDSSYYEFGYAYPQKLFLKTADDHLIEYDICPSDNVLVPNVEDLYKEGISSTKILESGSYS